MKYIISVLAGLFLFTAFPHISTAYAAEPEKINAYKTVYEMINDETIAFFEDEVAKQTVVSNISDRKIERFAEFYGVSEQKYKYLMCLRFMLEKYGYVYSMEELSELPDTNIYILTLAVYNLYWNSLSDAEKADINVKAQQIFEKYNTDNYEK